MANPNIREYLPTLSMPPLGVKESDAKRAAFLDLSEAMVKLTTRLGKYEDTLDDALLVDALNTLSWVAPPTHTTAAHFLKFFRPADSALVRTAAMRGLAYCAKGDRTSIADTVRARVKDLFLTYTNPDVASLNSEARVLAALCAFALIESDPTLHDYVMGRIEASGKAGISRVLSHYLHVGITYTLE